MQVRNEFQEDLNSPMMQKLLEQRAAKFKGSPAPPAVDMDYKMSKRTQTGIQRAQTEISTLLIHDPLQFVDPEARGELVQKREYQAIDQTFTPLIMAHHGISDPPHVRQMDLERAMWDCVGFKEENKTGGELRRVKTYSSPTPLWDIMTPDARKATPHLRESHAHYSSTRRAAFLRTLTFSIPTIVVEVDDDDDVAFENREALEFNYACTLVAQLVHQDDSDPLLCLRAFYYSQQDQKQPPQESSSRPPGLKRRL